MSNADAESSEPKVKWATYTQLLDAYLRLLHEHLVLVREVDYAASQRIGIFEEFAKDSQGDRGVERKCDRHCQDRGAFAKSDL